MEWAVRGKGENPNVVKDFVSIVARRSALFAGLGSASISTTVLELSANVTAVHSLKNTFASLKMHGAW